MISYRKGYKYQLAENYIRDTHIYGHSIETEFINLDKDGCLFIRSGYAWDGASSIAIDTDSSMEASLAHDAIYQLMRMELLPQSYRKYADNLFKKICIAKCMWKFRAKCWFIGVDKFAADAASPKQLKKVFVVP